jgi:thymidylate synthase (FAD)
MADTKINVLDKGYVRLVDSMGSDLSIVRAARVSFDADWRTGEDAGKDEALIDYLWRNRHATPFEAVEFQFEIKAPIFVFRQWHRHRTWSFNELSGRYAELPDEFYVPDIDDIGVQSKDNKQGRDQPAVPRSEDFWFAYEAYIGVCDNAFALYRRMLELGWPRELARTVLPLATYSRMFAKVDLRNLFAFLDLRLHEHAQYEIRVYAEALIELARPTAPVAFAAWEKHR